MGFEEKLKISWIFRNCFVPYRIVEERDLYEESNNNLKAENNRHLNNNIAIRGCL